MGTAYNPRVVTDGMVLCLDAANAKSYPGTGTTWTDLSGNGRNGTLVNGPAYISDNGGSIAFSGTNDYMSISGATPAELQGNPSFSVEGWFKKTSSWTQGATWGIGGNSVGQGINTWNFNSTDQITIDFWGTSTYSTGQTYSSTAWKHIVWTYNGEGFTTSNIVIYVDGVSYTGNGLTTLRGGTGTPAINSSGIVVGRAGTTTNNYYCKAAISNFKIYSRVLTAAEIKQNFNALRGRYGI